MGTPGRYLSFIPSHGIPTKTPLFPRLLFSSANPSRSPVSPPEPHEEPVTGPRSRWDPPVRGRSNGRARWVLPVGPEDWNRRVSCEDMRARRFPTNPRLLWRLCVWKAPVFYFEKYSTVVRRRLTRPVTWPLKFLGSSLFVGTESSG